jgi:hypothetical protein
VSISPRPPCAQRTRTICGRAASRTDSARQTSRVPPSSNVRVAGSTLLRVAHYLSALMSRLSNERFFCCLFMLRSRSKETVVFAEMWVSLCRAYLPAPSRKAVACGGLGC